MPSDASLEEIKENALKILSEKGFDGMDEAVAYMIKNWKMNEILMDIGILRVENLDLIGVTEWIKGFK
jgi:hypothetical protein